MKSYKSKRAKGAEKSAAGVSKRTKGVVFCGIFAALSFVFMFIGTLTGVLDLTAMVVSSLAVSFMVIEFGGMYPWLV